VIVAKILVMIIWNKLSLKIATKLQIIDKFNKKII